MNDKDMLAADGAVFLECYKLLGMDVTGTDIEAIPAAIKRLKTELAALREIARLATVIRTRYPGLLAVMWENDAEGSRKLPYMREKFDAAFAELAKKDKVTK